MASSISDSTGDSSSVSKKDRVIRQMPSCKEPTSEADEKLIKKYKQNVDLRKLMFMRNLLKAEVCFLARVRSMRTNLSE